MTSQNLLVAAPWSLSHYIPLNAFHPLYRALFDQRPSSVGIYAWDNVKLFNRFARDLDAREAVLSAANAVRRKTEQSHPGHIAKAYEEFFWPPNRVLTAGLTGDIEFHHTAPFPSLTRPFVFHCESFAPVFLPFAQQGSGEFKDQQELRRHYQRIFADPLCLGIFSHIPETLKSLGLFFADPVIERKLFSSRIGLSAAAFAGQRPVQRTSLARPKFLFVNSANQNPRNFFHRGGHVVLRFWQEFRAAGRDGFLMLRCAKPADHELRDHGVDVAFLAAETGRSLIWIEEYLANDEQNALMESAHFFLLPSASLHSVSIMQAMTLGTIPVVTDTVGTGVYVKDGEHGIVLDGVRAAIWYSDPATGVLLDRYRRMPELDSSLVSQLTRRIFALLDTPGAYDSLRDRAVSHARRQFSGDAFSADFWGSVSELHERSRRTAPPRVPAHDTKRPALDDCTLQGGDWARIFESVTQPMRRIHTGQHTVWELGGAFVHRHGSPHMELSDWCVLSQYFSPGAPRLFMANSLQELGGKYLSFGGERSLGASRKLVDFVSRVLMPFPALHRFGSRKLKLLRGYRRYLAFKFGKAGMEPDVELALHGVSGYNVIRYFHRFYAIPQSEGAFSLERVRAGGYSSCFSGNSLEKVLRDVNAAVPPAPPPVTASANLVQPELVVEGFYGFNIIRLGNEFHAILQREGAFDYAKVLARKYSQSFSGRSVDEIQSAIVASLGP